MRHTAVHPQRQNGSDYAKKGARFGEQHRHPHYPAESAPRQHAGLPCSPDPSEQRVRQESRPVRSTSNGQQEVPPQAAWAHPGFAPGSNLRSASSPGAHRPSLPFPGNRYAARQGSGTRALASRPKGPHWRAVRKRIFCPSAWQPRFKSETPPSGGAVIPITRTPAYRVRRLNEARWL